MNARVIRVAEQVVMPWANGGGSTAQVAIDPPGATVAGGFRWRVSVAQVTSDGPFSKLAGVDRSLWLVRGNGFRLDVGGREVVLDQEGARCDFAGEDVVACRLVAGPCEDLNVMVAREKVRVDAAWHELARGAALLVAPAPQRLLLVLRGAVEVAGVGRVGERDALRVDGGGVVEGRASDAGCALLVAAFAAR